MIKKFLIAFILIVSLFSCSSNSKSSYRKADTVPVLTVAEYADPLGLSVFKSKVFKVEKDTAKINSSGVLEMLIDTIYYMPISEPVKDSAGKVQKDSSGNTQVKIMWRRFPKEFLIHDYNKALPNTK